MRILVTNDDGIGAAGIKALAEAMTQLGDVTVVAPDRERSATGHSLTLHAPLRIFELKEHWFAVDGTPTDCVNMGIHNLLPFRPDLVVSGINQGSNMGDDITYSGTVAAAMEANLMGIPALAISLASYTDTSHFNDAATSVLPIIQTFISNGLPNNTFLNINIPNLPLAEIKPPMITRQGKRSFVGSIIDKVDPWGRKYYWIGSEEPSFIDEDGTDFHAVGQGNISITPLHLDLTNYNAMDLLNNWNLQ
ncbi:MAG: 5'/3'-nucleotidase SurE [Trichlorobacter sp.]|nr:5'/3'-nucleotidase SurE [Trichlorobacter sp.]